MHRWLISLAAAVLASGVGVAINLATDLKTVWWAWAAVVVLTIAVGAITALTQPSGTRQSNPQNVITGKVTGQVVQARDISAPVILSGDRLDTDPDQRASQ